MFSIFLAAGLLSAANDAVLRIDIDASSQRNLAPHRYALVLGNVATDAQVSRVPIDAALRAHGWLPVKDGETPDVWIRVEFGNVMTGSAVMAQRLDPASYRSWLALEALDRSPALAGPRRLLWRVLASTETRDADYRRIYPSLVSAAQQYIGTSASPLTTVTVRPAAG